MRDFYNSYRLTLEHLIDSKTGKNIEIDLSDMTLPARRELQKAYEAGQRLGKKLSAIKTNRGKE